VHLLIVCSDDQRKAAEARLSEVAARIGTAVKRAVIRSDDVERSIIRYADEANADVVFVNATGEIGTIKQDIIRRSDTPVMLVPASGELRAASR
jgi:nucleotide-binding universal stress UspA family protein